MGPKRCPKVHLQRARCPFPFWHLALPIHTHRHTHTRERCLWERPEAQAAQAQHLKHPDAEFAALPVKHIHPVTSLQISIEAKNHRLQRKGPYETRYLIESLPKRVCGALLHGGQQTYTELGASRTVYTSREINTNKLSQRVLAKRRLTEISLQKTYVHKHAMLAPPPWPAEVDDGLMLITARLVDCGRVHPSMLQCCQVDNTNGRSFGGTGLILKIAQFSKWQVL